MGNVRGVHSSGHRLMTMLVALRFAKGCVCVCVLTACLHAPRSSLDLNRAFISK